MSEAKSKSPLVNILIVALVIAILGGMYFLKSGRNRAEDKPVTEGSEEAFPALVDYGSHG